MTRARRYVAVASLALAASRAAHAQAGNDWPAYAGDLGATKYSTLADVNRTNVSTLARAWEWATGETPNAANRTRPGNFQATPLMIGDTLYLSTSYNRVVALDANSGRELWAYDPKAYVIGQPPNGTGFVHRGVATWSDGTQRRIFMNSRWNLIALDAATGRPIRSFGDTGVVDLTRALGRNGKAVNKLHYTQTSPPVVWSNLVIVGNGVADKLVYPNDPPGDVQAFDVKTGRRVWSYSPVPLDKRDDGASTWANDSWRTMGHTNVWAPFSVDERRGLVYLPVSTPSNDWYGGARKGNDLYAESIVCLDAKSGKRVWYFQTVHHGLWDYDIPAAPVLATVRVDGRPRDIVAVPTKMGFLFVFDRQNGAPIWPIEERSVPASDVPGEAAAQSQPVPTRPKPFAKQGFGFNDLIDFTPDIRARALDAIKEYRVGPLFTPPSTDGTIVMPGAIGGAGWGGGALDPASGTIYIKTTNQPALYRIVQPSRSDTLDADYTVDLAGQSLRVTIPSTDSTQRATSLPINKPPYGTLVAIDLNTGDERWTVTLGDTPGIRNNPLLKDLKLPPVGVAGAPGPIVTAGGLIFVTGGGSTLYAIDTRNGAVLWSSDLGQSAYAVPMTYRTKAGKQFVVIATGAANGAKLVAFALP
ncbi:MAG: Pyrrolo-quinoline quinone repeat-containing protein [Gemmatimonadetes bacterium]|nr:Pyrrolo-quinoline quinone repeat-containing protein [Gemmatimonadota bacterium]